MKQRSHDTKELRRRLKEIAHLATVQSLLFWDQEVNMPKKGADVRAGAIAELSGILHTKFLALDNDKLLSELKRALDAKTLRGKDAIVVAETWRSYERTTKLPESYVREEAEVTSRAQNIWAEARAKNDFKMFLPWLRKIVALKQQEATYVGFKESPYDALLDVYEPGMTTKEATIILDDLKDFLIPFLRELRARKEKRLSAPKGAFPLDRQKLFNAYIASHIGFDFDAGRLDASTHPFTSGAHPFDVRLTTRYKEQDLWYAIGSTIHEAGHGIYEQGLPHADFGTPLSESVSLGIHESQSRFWENHMGKSLPFWKFFYPKLQKEFPVPYKKIPLEDFYRIVNRVEPSLIRTEADEVTYNLHIIIRFEIEREMIEGSLELRDLPKVWQSKVKDYLGIEVPTDSVGCLQDVHWSSGLIGYFPTYSFGNLYAAQFDAAMRAAIPDRDKKVAKGDFTEVRSWLRTHIHARGKTYTADALVRKVTGEPLNSRYFADYLKEKYRKTS